MIFIDLPKFHLYISILFLYDNLISHYIKFKLIQKKIFNSTTLIPITK